MKRISLIIIFSIWLAGCGVNETNQRSRLLRRGRLGAGRDSNLISARVERVVSGQTLEIEAIAIENNNKITKVRIIGIDAPDLKQFPWGAAAKQRLTELIAGKSILLETPSQTTDKFDRLLAHVWHNKTSIGEQLVKEGYVLADTKYPHKYSQRFMNAREYARLLGYGIWNSQQPMRVTPSQFRSKNSSS